MLFVKLFITFFKIGLFNFGGGYAMIPLIQHEIVEKNHWMTNNEFTDIIAISQMTPGPIGINSATYAGYQATYNELATATVSGEMSSLTHYLLSITGSFIATFSVCLPSFILLLAIAKMLVKYMGNRNVKQLFAGLRPVIVGLIAASALLLMDSSNFGFATSERIISVLICAGVFLASWKYKIGPITLLIASGLLGLLIY
ncbi:MAG: chromate transporter [Bacteroidales bacterium]|nr:chromate transporter [Bacteroidales bacterium]MDD4822685.1 chromate transporter [Bacteroidales bacterium]